MCSILFIKTLFNRGGLLMPNENKNSPNTIKYSIWNTRTDEPTPEIKDKIVKSMAKPILNSKNTDNRD
jgi:hypothetical protein